MPSLQKVLKSGGDVGFWQVFFPPSTEMYCFPFLLVCQYGKLHRLIS